jgi:hypothetical protein
VPRPPAGGLADERVPEHPERVVRIGGTRRDADGGGLARVNKVMRLVARGRLVVMMTSSYGLFHHEDPHRYRDRIMLMVDS